MEELKPVVIFAHYLPENKCKSFIVTSGGELIKFIDKDK